MIKFVIYAFSILLLISIIILIVVTTNKNKKLNQTSEIIRELLPGLNCKQCGRDNCASFAVDATEGKTTINKCPYLVGANFKKARQVMKKTRQVKYKSIAFVKCKGGKDCKDKYTYVGDETCASKNLLHDGEKACPYACLGCGDCVKSCVYGAISISKKGCAIIDRVKCIGCGECVDACPKKLISLIPTNKFVDVVCSNSSNDSVVTRNCDVSCTHCEACVMACPAKAIKMVGGLPQIDESKCIKCGKCVAVCPTHVISRL